MFALIFICMCTSEYMMHRNKCVLTKTMRNFIKGYTGIQLGNVPTMHGFADELDCVPENKLCRPDVLLACVLYGQPGCPGFLPSYPCFLHAAQLFRVPLPPVLTYGLACRLVELMTASMYKFSKISELYSCRP